MFGLRFKSENLNSENMFQYIRSINIVVSNSVFIINSIEKNMFSNVVKHLQLKTPFYNTIVFFIEYIQRFSILPSDDTMTGTGYDKYYDVLTHLFL